MKPAQFAAHFIAIGLGLVVAPEAKAQSWFFLTEVGDFKIFVDDSSIARTGNLATLTTLLVQREIGEGGVVAVLVEEQYACDNRERRELLVNYLYGDQSVRRENSTDTSWQRIREGTIADIKLQLACNR